jgi:hypothetical protein
VLLVALLVLMGCPASTPADPTDIARASDLSAYFIDPDLCKDSVGPDCTKLRLGDAHLTTTTPSRGKLYACAEGNPSAPGSVRSLITWIDDAAGTWDLLRKPFLPAGNFAPLPGTSTMTQSGATRTIVVTNLPVDAKIGDWPMTKYSALSVIDPNPGTPAERNYSFAIPVAPTVAASPSCVSLGAIGVTLNGVVLYNAVDARGHDAVAHEIVDVYGGHPAMSDYHYHFVPERLDHESVADGHSELVGYMRDGFGLYGYKGVGGQELSNADLDECHGHDHLAIGYHYHATVEYPYTIGCFRGTPQ